MAAKWSWKNDQDKWIAYDAKLSAKIEKEFKLGRKSCDVDDERFVDIPNLLQRRKDDMSKCRLVKREEPLPLSEYVFLLLGDDLMDSWEDDITKHGGLITEYLTDKVDLAWKCLKFFIRIRCFTYCLIIIDAIF